MATIKRSLPSDPEFIARLAEEYDKAKKFAEKAAKHADSLKKQLSEIVDGMGEADEKGNLWYSVGPYELKRERRVSRALDTPSAEEWARQQNLWHEVAEVREVLSEERLLALAWERRELSSTISSFYTEKEVWAFKLTEKKDDEEEDL